MKGLNILYYLQLALLILIASPIYSQYEIDVSSKINEQSFIFTCQHSFAANDTIIWNFGDDCYFSPAFNASDCNFIEVGKTQVEHQYVKGGVYTVTARIKGKLFVTNVQVNFPDEIKDKRTSTIHENGSFENYTTLPYKISQINYATPWRSATNATPDYFHLYSQPSQVSNWSVQIPQNFAGFSYSPDGNAYAGIITYYQSDTSTTIGENIDTNNSNYREYIYQILNDTLMNNIQYRINFKIKLSSKSRVKTPIGFYLSDSFTEFKHNKVIMLNPAYESMGTSDTANWTTIEHIITAKGGEKYLVIGNFQTDTSSSISDLYPSNFIQSKYGGTVAAMGYYYIDQVVVDFVTGGIIKPGGTILVEKGENIKLNAKTFICTSGSSYFWSSDKSSKEISDQKNNQSIIFQPIENMMIYLNGVDGCGHIIYDSVKIISLNTSIENSEKLSKINFYPNPNKGSFNLQFHAALGNQIEILIFNDQGVQIKKQCYPVVPGNNKILVEVDVINGIYSMIISMDKRLLYHQQIVIAK